MRDSVPLRERWGGSKRSDSTHTDSSNRLTQLGRAAPSAWALHDALQRQPVATAASLAAATGLTAATVNKTLVHLERAGVVSETTSRQRGRVFAYTDYVALLNAELEVTPLPKVRRPRKARQH